MKSISFQQFINSSKNNYLVIDVRDRDEFNQNHLNGSINIPLNILPTKLNNLNPMYTYYVICDNGTKSKSAYHLLKTKNFRVVNISNGLNG